MKWDWSDAKPAPLVKAPCTRQRRHYNEIMGDFVVHLMGLGTFGWPPIEKKGRSKKHVAHIPDDQVDCDIVVDCCGDDKGTLEKATQKMLTSPKAKRPTLKEVHLFLSAPVGVSDALASQTMRRWCQAAFKQSKSQVSTPENSSKTTTSQTAETFRTITVPSSSTQHTQTTKEKKKQKQKQQHNKHTKQGGTQEGSVWMMTSI